MVVSNRMSAESPAPSGDSWPYHDVEWTSIPVRLLSDGERRMEAESYLSEGFGIRRLIEACPGFIRLGDLASISLPPRTKSTLVNPEEGNPYLTASQVFEQRPFPRKWLAEGKIAHARALSVKGGTILVTRSGSVGRATLAFKPHTSALVSDDLLRVQPREHQAWGWIYAYLRAPRVRAMMKSRNYGHIVKHLEVSHLKELPIPPVDKHIMAHFIGQASQVLAMRDQAFSAKMEAEAIYAQCLGVPDIKSSEGGIRICLAFACEFVRLETKAGRAQT